MVRTLVPSKSDDTIAFLNRSHRQMRGPARVATPVGIMDRRKENSGNVMVRAAFRATIETPVQSVQCANTATKRETATGGSELRQGDVVSCSIRYNGCDKVFGKRYLAWRKIEFSRIGTMSGRPVAELRCSCYSDDVVVINSVSNDKEGAWNA